MKKVILFLVFGMIFLTACKQDKNVDDNVKLSVNDAKKTKSNASKSNSVKTETTDDGSMKLVNPCDLISKNQLADILNIDSDLLTFQKSKNAGKYSRSCSISWSNVENGEINRLHFTLQVNPLPGDFEDFSKSFLDAKIENGDMGYPNDGKPYKYKKVDGFKDASAYNAELKRLYWRVNPDYLFSIYFNAGFPSKVRQDYALDISKILNRNLNKEL